MARVPVDIIATHATTGQPLAGTRLFVYQRGTTTQVSVYATESGGSPVVQPLVADAEGRYPRWVAPGSYDLASPDDNFNPTQAWEAVSHSYIDEVVAGGIEKGSVEVTSNITHTGAVVGSGSPAVTLLAVEKGTRPQVGLVNAPWVSVNAANGIWVVFLERSPAGAGTYSIVGARSGQHATSGHRFAVDLRFPVMRQAAGSYDYRLQFQTGNAAHTLTIVCDSGVAVGPLTLQIIEA